MNAIPPQHRHLVSAASHPLAMLVQEPLSGWKRAFDVVAAAALLLVTAPVFAVAAVLVRCSSPGPVILRQRRTGLHGAPFVLFKFRTMVAVTEPMQTVLQRFHAGPVFKIRNGLRVTKVGRFLRGTSVDELPQLWNVLRGDMSLLGPRPPTLDEVRPHRAWQPRLLS